MCNVHLGVFLPTLAHSTFGARYEGHNNFCICFIRSVHMCGGSLLLGGGGTLAPKGGGHINYGYNLKHNPSQLVLLKADNPLHAKKVDCAHSSYLAKYEGASEN